MAQYEQSTEDVVTAFADSGLDTTTSDAIEALLTGDDTKVEVYDGGAVAEGTDLVTVAADVALAEDPGAPVIIMAADSAGADIVLDTSGGDRMLVAGGGDDVIVAEGDGNVSVETGGGNDTVSTGVGDDQIVITGDGESSVSTGDGGDAIVVTGGGSSTVDTGTGNDVITLASDTGEVTVDGGVGFDQLAIAVSRDDVAFTVEEGIVVMASGASTEMSGVEVVEFDDGISVLASSQSTSSIARMYEVLFDREADLGGLEYWTGRADAGESLADVTAAFVAGSEADSLRALDTNDFLDEMYLSMAGRAADDEGKAYWTAQLEAGMTMAEVATRFAASDEAVTLMGINGTEYVIDIG